MYILDLLDCGPSDILRIILFIKKLIDIAFIIIPIGLIIFLIFDLFKSLTYNGSYKILKEDELSERMSEGVRLAIKRMLNAVILFFVPTIVSMFMGLMGNIGIDYASCMSDVNNESVLAIANYEIAAETSKKEAEEQAKLAILNAAIEESKNREKAQQIYLATTNSTIKGKGCEGLVYYSEGTFYKPSSATQNGTTETMGSGEYGYNKYFLEMLKLFTEAATEAGYKVSYSTNNYGAWRPIEIQYYFACCDSRSHSESIIPYTIPNSLCTGDGCTCTGSGTCNNGNLAATVGQSNHGWGVASDLSFGSKEAMDWAHINAEKYGLHFSVCEDYFGGSCIENWHIQPISLITDDSVVEQCK